MFGVSRRRHTIGVGTGSGANRSPEREEPDMTDKAPAKVDLYLLVTVHDEYGQVKLRAEIVRKNPNEGEAADYPYLSTSWSYGGFEPGSEFDGFAATAYVGDGGNMWGTKRDNRGVWGIGVQYAPHHIETARHASAIARVLGRVERGLAKANETGGYLAEGDFAAHVLRIARILRVKDIVVRNHNGRNRTYSGEKYRTVNGTGMQYWVRDVVESVEKGTHRADFMTDRVNAN